MNFALILLTFITILSDVIELTYDLGQYTRKYVLPAVIYSYCFIQYHTNKMYDKLVTLDYDLRVYNTPLTTGLA